MVKNACVPESGSVTVLKLHKRMSNSLVACAHFISSNFKLSSRAFCHIYSADDFSMFVQCYEGKHQHFFQGPNMVP